jgi:NCS1 family nucleobase:cation symporter-1
MMNNTNAYEKIEIETATHESPKPIHSHESLNPIPKDERYWSFFHFAALWATLSISLPQYMFGATMVASMGFNWWQTVLVVLIGNIIALVPLILNAWPGTQFGISFPVFCRASFGTRGAIFVALLRGVVGIGWFAMQNWAGTEALYAMCIILFPVLKTTPLAFIGINITQVICYLLFVCLNLTIAMIGFERLKTFQLFAAPSLLLFFMSLLVWGIAKVGLSDMLQATYDLQNDRAQLTFMVWASSIAACVGQWSTMILNILDYSRFSKSQVDQIVGQSISLPIVISAFSFISIAVTGASYRVYGVAMWNPVQLFIKFENPYIVSLCCLVFSVAIIASNVGANLVSAGNDIANVSPKHITYRLGCVITCIISVVVFPWKLFATSHGFVEVWLLGSGLVMGCAAGVLLADYYLVRTFNSLSVDHLYIMTKESQYYYTFGFQVKAMVAAAAAIVPPLPGFLAESGFIPLDSIPRFMLYIYDLGWFVSVFSSFVLYLILWYTPKGIAYFVKVMTMISANKIRYPPTRSVHNEHNKAVEQELTTLTIAPS